ncbi:hypothetical protein ENBRE01_2353 [Enteropsectra breve]|nr:hypothetical protein ENBRE01_2353 [Enteropsectra breve]
MRIIDIQQGICSCMDTKEYGFPCVHACALVRANIVSKENFISNKRLVGALKQVYGGYVAMVDLEQLEQGAANGAAEQRRRGRPRSNERIRAH